MSLFFITNDLGKINYISEKVTSITNKQAYVADLVAGYKIIYSENKSHTFLRASNGNAIFGIGTYFNEKGFHSHAVSDVNSLADFIECQKQGLYGHYVFVIADDDRIFVITDKIGLINIFYSGTGPYYYISPDLTLLSICSGNYSLSEYGVKQFVMKESCVGRLTLFDDIHRLMFGCALCIDKNILSETTFYEYESDALDFKAYAGRVRSYFNLLNGYVGKITTDLSAGIDTRLVASVAAGEVKGIKANTNPNQFDDGVDEAVAPVIAKLLNIELQTITNSDTSIDYTRMMHLFSIGRDIFRSRYWPARLERKYKMFDLSLGGYGGETIRAKYNRLNIEDYYSKEKACLVFDDADYGGVIKEQLSHYPKFVTQDQSTNYLYTVDRMRVWGGTQVYFNSHYGETLHPFMDWNLIGPVFGFDTTELYKGRLQERLIYRFAPVLSGVPINSLRHKKRMITLSDVKKLVKNHTPSFMVGVVEGLQSILNSSSKKRVEEFFLTYPKDKFDTFGYQDIGIDVERLADFSFTYLTRLATINEAVVYIKKESELLRRVEYNTSAR